VRDAVANFWHITLPNLRLSLIASGLLIFTLSMDEIAVTFSSSAGQYFALEIWGRLAAASLRN